MLSRSIRRVLSDSSWSMPPTFLLPWAAQLSTVSHTPIAEPALTPSASSATEAAAARPATSIASAPAPADALSLPAPGTDTPALSPSVRNLLPLLKAQGPHYITAHIHGKPYLVTPGDTVRLPFFMHGVAPGDVLRLNRAVNLGSREYTLKAAAAGPRLKSPTMDTTNIMEITAGPPGELAGLASSTRAMPDPAGILAPATSPAGALQYAPHFIPHIAKGKYGYVDERLFECRAVVMGADSEPLRIKEKTKRRRRHVQKIKSKHRFTILRIKELRIKDVEEVEGQAS